MTSLSKKLLFLIPGVLFVAQPTLAIDFDLSQRLLLAVTPSLDAQIQAQTVSLANEDLIKLGVMSQAHSFCSTQKCGDIPCQSALSYLLIEKTISGNGYFFYPTADGNLAKKAAVLDGRKPAHFFKMISCSANPMEIAQDDLKVWKQVDPQLLSTQMVELLGGPHQCGLAPPLGRRQKALKYLKSWIPTVKEKALGWLPADTTPAKAGKVALASIGTALKASGQEILNKPLQDIASMQTATNFLKYYVASAAGELLARPEDNDPSPQQAEALSNLTITEVLKNAKKYSTDNSKLLLPEQKLFLQKLILAAEREVSAHIQRKIAEGQKVGLNTSESFNQILRSVKNSKLEPTLGEVILARDKDPEMKSLSELLQKLNEIMRLPISPLALGKDKLELVETACGKSLATWRTDYRDKLMNIGSSLLSDDAQSRSGFHFFYGDAGTGKTDGIKILAQCYGAPACVIRAQDVSDYVSKQRKDERKAALMALAGHPAGNSYGAQAPQATQPDILTDAYKALIVDCYKDKFVDASGKKTITGLVLMDDFDKVLEQLETGGFIEASNSIYGGGMSGGAPKNPLIEQIRQHLFNFIKEFTDPSQATMSDPKTGYPINLAGIRFFGTSNSIPAELRKQGEPKWVPLVSRTDYFEVRPAEEKERLAYRETALQKIKDRLIELKPHYDFSQFDENVCRAKIAEIVDYDLVNYRNSPGSVGFRALSNLVTLYRDVVVAKVESTHPCGLAQFDVQARGRDCADYEKVISAELLEARFHDTATDFKRQVQKILDKVSVSQEFRNALEQNITAIDKDRKRPVEEKTRALEAMLAQVKGLENQIDFTRPEVVSDIRARFIAKFSHYKTPENNELYVEHASFINQVLKKLSTKSQKNKPFLIKKASVNADTGSIGEIAETIGVPVCQIDDPLQMGTIVDPSWHPMRSDKGSEAALNYTEYYNYRLPNGVSLSSPYINYDSELGAFAVRQGEFTTIAKKGADGVIKLKTFTQDEIGKKPELDLTWWRECQGQISANPGQAIIVLNFPKDAKLEQIQQILKKSSELIQKKLYTSVDGSASIDPSQFTLLASIDNAEDRAEVEKTFAGGLDKLTVNTLPISVRAPYAHATANQLLKELDPTGKLTINQVDEKDKELLQRIIDFDRYQAKAHNGQISTIPLKMVLRDVWLPRVKDKADDILGIYEADTNIKRRYQAMLETYTANGFAPKAIAAEKGARSNLLDRLSRRLLNLKQTAKLDPSASNVLLQAGNQKIKSFFDWRREKYINQFRAKALEHTASFHQRNMDEKKKREIDKTREAKQRLEDEKRKQKEAERVRSGKPLDSPRSSELHKHPKSPRSGDTPTRPELPKSDD